MPKPAKSTAAKQFGRRVDAYATSFAHAAGPDLDILVRLLEAQPTDVVREVIRGKLLDASPTIRSTFDILIEEGRPIRFTDEKLILRADCPGSS
jgi:hypothetical protein